MPLKKLNKRENLTRYDPNTARFLQHELIVREGRARFNIYMFQ